MEGGRRAHCWRLIGAAIVVVGLVGGLLLGSGARAQTTTQPLDPLASVPVAYCNVAPRTAAELAALAQGPAIPDGTDIREPVRYVIGAGTPADPVVAIAVDAVMVQLAACLNSGDYGRVYALFSDQALAVILVPDDIDAVASGTPTPLLETEGYLPPLVWDVRIQDDERVTAVVEFDGEYALVTFVWNGERYLIELYDDQIDVNAVPPVASPVGG